MGHHEARRTERHRYGSVSSASQQRGARVESQALDYLLGQGLQLIDKNFHCRYGEIDLIMREHETLVFTEVRYRAATAHASAVESVDARKQRRIIRSAEYYLQRHPEQAWRNCRFDVLGVDDSRDQQRLEWVKDAFQS